MSKRFKAFRDKVALSLIAVSAVLLLLTALGPQPGVDSSSVARRMERNLGKRLDLLDYYAERPSLRLPDDMVIYRYVADTLQSWRNQFAVLNDDIESRVVLQRLVNPRLSMLSPLSGIGEQYGYYNLGSKWYVARSVPDDTGRTVEGLEIINPQSGHIYNSVNRRLGLDNRYTVKPLDSSGGSEVCVDGVPMFKVLCENLSATPVSSIPLVWAAFGCFLVGMLVFVSSRRTLRRAMIAVSGVLASSAAMYFWGLLARQDLRIFSPVLYAGNGFLYSLGAVFLVNLAIFVSVLSIYLAREDVFRKIRSASAVLLALLADLVLVVLIGAYTHWSLSSIITDSGISLELYKLASLSPYTGLVYLSYLTMMVSLPVLLEMLQPAFSYLTGRHVNVLSRSGRIVFAVLSAIYLVLVSSILGFEKEEDRVGVWANRLAVDRDISLELQLRRTERSVAGDVIISTLSMMQNSESVIQNRIVDSYLPSVAQDYKIGVVLFREADMDSEQADFLDRRLRYGEPIADGSTFVCTRIPEGGIIYSGLFLYYNENAGLVRLLLEVEQKTGVGEKGYASILNLSHPGRMSIPSGYSYGRYSGRDLVMFGGSYSYQTKMNDKLHDDVYVARACHVKNGGYVHFITVVSDDEAVLVSRPQISNVNYGISAMSLMLLAFLLVSLLTLRRPRKSPFSTSYFKTRISWVLLISLLLTLVSMAAVSVTFVYERNDANMRAIMTDKINSVQSLVQDGIKEFRGRMDRQNLTSVLDAVSENTKTDITLYSTDGRLLMSTTPEVFERMLLGCRVNEDAYDVIMKENRRYHIQKEKLGRTTYYSMYAPLTGPDGRMMAILCSPYTDKSYDFEHDAVLHSMMIVTLFIMLLIFARFMTVKVLDRMFKPLSEMSRKMSRGGLGSLEYIDYDRNDEISSLVQAYNRMVTQLADSSVRLAQAERDKAWSGMARQVAHEIKNPLTPMKLQIQRLIRLKSRGDGSWQDKFDDVSRVLLDHIDILTDTANEFSTFAKLYSEEHTIIDLDAVLKEEIAMFDGREDVRFEYYGLAGASVMGPKPQLTRVFVNLINNSVQALDGTDGGIVIVSLRNSVRDGFYDIVFEDNGPGVAPENVDRLFTPNFTTKNAGSGLGLAISRSILEKCEATISYSRSFTLGGACFTITYPK